MDRKARLQHVESTGWIGKYRGKNIIKGYCKWFAVDLVCAIIELRKMGVSISEEREAQIRESVQAHADARRRRKQVVARKRFEALYADCDGTYAFIAGYTSGGAPYGVTWEELGEKPPEFDEDWL